MTYCISFSSCCVCGPLVNKENLPKNHQPLKGALSLMREKISKSGTPVMDFTHPRYNSISNMHPKTELLLQLNFFKKLLSRDDNDRFA